MHPFRYLSRIIVFPALLPSLALAVPTAVNDTYSTPEDVAVSGNMASAPILVTGFEAGTGGFTLPASWDYLDTIPAAATTYPVDGEAVSWKSLAFAKATSTVAGWKTAALPIQGGGVNAFPAAPSILLGITGGGGVNTVTTYLFRTTFTMTAAEAANAWSARLVADDGCIVYVNGVEAARLNYTTDVPVSPDAFVGGQGGNEDTYTNVPLTVPFVAGSNCIAIELHQNSNNSSDAGIDLSLILASADPLQGLGYVDDVDGTNRPASGAGGQDSAIGNPGSSVNVVLSRGFGGGGGGGGSGANVSGGWRKTIAVPTAGNLRIQCDARARTTNLEDNEFAEAIVVLDGARLTIAGRNYLVRQVGPNPAATPANSGTSDSNWGSYTIEVPVTAGNHVIAFGGFGPRPSADNNGDFFESGTVNFDNINVSLIGTAGSLLDNDTGGVAPVTAVKVSDPAHGTVTINASGSFTYTPALNYFGADTFTYKAVDGTGESAPATVTINVTPVNDAPVAVADGPHTTPQGEALVVGEEESVLANDTDVETAVLTAVMGTPSPDGTTVLNPDGSFTFTPNPSFAGTATFTYRASDGTAQSAPVTVTINVTDLPDPPTAVTDTYTAVKNTPLVVAAIVAGNTTDEVLPYEAQEWHYYDSMVAANRNLGTSWRTDTYTENADWKVGQAELGYSGNPTEDDENTIIADNPDPAFDPGAGDKFITYYFRRNLDITNTWNVISAVMQLRYDDGGVIYINGTEAARTANMGAPGSAVTFDQLATGNTNDNSTQDFNLQASAFLQGSNLIAAEIHQNGATSSDISFDLRIRLTRATAAGVLANDLDPDPGQKATLTAEIVGQPAHGSLTLNADGTFTYTPANGYTGADSFTYRAKDSTNLTSAGIATANITVVTGPNVPPVANPDTYTVAEDAALNVATAGNGVLANDTDAENDPFTAVIVAQPVNGTLTLDPTGTFTYQPNANFNGVDTFTYRATDTRPSTPATVTITVTPVNDPPVSANDSYAGDPGVPFVVPAAQGVLANDSDVDAGTVLTAEIVTPPAAGSLTLNADGSFTFTAATGGVYSFTYRAKDATSQSGISTATISLNAVPVTQPDSYTTDEDQTIHGEASGGFSVLANDSDPEGQSLTAQLVGGVQHGTLELEADGGFHYTPAPNYFGGDSFTYRATDGTRTSAPVLVSITVNAVNDAPVAVADTYGVRVDTPLVISAASGVLRNDTDVDSSTLTATLISQPVDGTLTLSPDGSFTYTPVLGFSGASSFTYRVSDGAAQSAVVTVTLNVTTDLNTLSISEIMFNPPGTTGRLEEFIEIHNYGDAAVDLTGWGFTKGVDFAFENGTLIAGRGYLAIPANKVAFSAKYPAVVNVTANDWSTTGGSLGNGGELIRLKNATDETVDEVEYSDNGDWAERRIVNVWDATNTPGSTPANGLDTDPGLEWYTTADPDPEIGNLGGSSIQLVNTGLSNDAGANWTASAPTPGAANAAVARTNSAPLIREVVHSPAVPNATQQVFVTARIDDELTSGYTASVFYRTWGANSTAPDAAAFTEAAMADNGLRNDGVAGDGVFGAVIPAQALNKVVEFYVRASDAASNVRTWPAPTLDINGANPVQDANCLYQVNEEVWTDHRPLYQLVLTGADNAAFNAGLNNRQTNVAPNATVIFRQGGKFDVRYCGGIRPRGNSSRSDTPMNLRMDIPGDRPWNGRTAFTLNYKYSYCQFISTRLFEAAGVPSEKSGAVGMRLNGLNRLLVDASGAAGPNGVRTFGYYCDLIPRGGDTIKEWFPDNDDGNGYGKIRAGFGGTRWAVSTLPVIGPNGYATGGYVDQGYTKQTNAAQNDWTDVHAWMQSLQAGTNETFHTVIANTVDIDEWCRFLAMSTIINHGETNMANGDDDDYSIYFGATDKLCRIIAHDLDTCFNLNAIGLGDEQAPANTTIYQCTDPNYIDNATLPQMDKFYRNPVTGRKFKAALRHYLDTIFAKVEFDATVDELLDSQWMGTVAGYPRTGDEIRTHIKTFLDQRRATIETFLPTAFTAATTLAVQNGLPRTTSATDLGALGGKIDPARTAEVKVNGIKVTTNPYGSTAAADNTWSAGTAVTLSPGINTLVCTALDEKGAVFATQTVTIWYDAAGVNRSGTLAASETWSPAAGPYNVTASITVPTGVTLTIEPGTTVFLATGADITVSAGGRIQAVGTAAAGITLTRIPSGTGTWGGITVSGATTEPTRLSYVAFENNGDAAFHSQNGANVELDHLTFRNPAEQYLSLDASSFLVSDCVFPTSTAAFEPVHGSGGIAAGGRGIIRNCWFGKTQGYNDSIDFSGGNRPGPILHIYNCIFTGSDDDILDLDSTDTWVEGNVFMHAHRNGSPDSASAVSGGADNADYSQVTVINNLFYDCDNAVTMKQGNNQPNGNSAAVLYNTIVRTTRTGGEDTGSGVLNFDDVDVSGEGKGFHVEGNIIWDAESLTRDYVPANSALTMINNWLPVAPPATATASGNTVGDPLLNLALITTPGTATAEQVIAALKPQACSPALGYGADLSRPALRAAIPQGATWPASISINVGPGGSFTPATQTAWTYGYTHYKYRLDSGAETAETPIATPLALSGLAQGNHTLTITGKDDGGEWTPAGLSYSFFVAADAPTVLLSEVNAAASSGTDWIELHNYGTAAASLAGCSIFAADSLPLKLTFTAASSIPAGGRLIVDGTQLGFNLNRSGEIIHFQSPSGAELDLVTYGPQITDLSVARTANGWALSTPTPGAANTAVCVLGTGTSLRINEWLGSNDIIVAGDFVELYNGETNPVSITDWRISQDFRNEPEQNVFPPLSFIAAGGFLELIADGDTAAGADHLNFKVSSIHDSIALLNPAGQYVDSVYVLPGNPDVSQGRTADGGAITGYLPLPTPGFSNSSNLTADTAVMNGLRITELMFDPPGAGPEYIEFKNISGAALTITGVTFDSGLTFTFPATTVAAGGYAVITNVTPAAFAGQYPGITAVQWTGGRLDNNGETVRVETGSYGLGILDFRYGGDWYSETRAGASLEIIDPAAPRGTWSDQASWQPAVPSPGGPGTFGVLAPLDLTIAPADTAILHGFVSPGAFTIGSITIAWSKVSGPGTVNFTAPANKDTDASFTAPGIYELRLTATPPGGAPSASDSIIVTVSTPYESYDAWAARTLAGYSAAQQDETADADNDGNANLVEHVLGTNPAVASPGPELILSNGRLALRYTISKTADPAIQVIPQIGGALAAWQDGPAVINDFFVSETAALQTRIAEDTGALGASGKKYLRLKVVRP